MIRNALVAILFVALPAAARAQPPVPDLGDYQALLAQYICPVAAKGAPYETRFDYEQLYVDEKIWTLKRSARLEKIHAQLLAARPSAMTPAERVAWGVNTYNFLVIENITTNLILPPRRNRRFTFIRYTSVDQMLAGKAGFFRTNVGTVEGREYTLDDFQRRFVFGDTTRGSGPRAPLSDPRLRFATSPGRIGGPPLLPFPFRPDSLDQQLDRAARTALALPGFVTLKPNPPTLFVSDWLTRDPGDFGGTTQGMLEFVMKYAPRAVRDGMRQAKLTGVGGYMPANPNLNQKAHPKVVMPTPADADTAAS